MPTIWIVSRERTLPETLGYHLRSLGSARTGPPDRGLWKEAETPDLIVLIGAESEEDLGAFADLENFLDFLGWVPRRRRSPQPVLYVEPASGRPGSHVVRQLIDDRPLRILGWPLEPDELLAASAALLDQPQRPASMRERARRSWVARRVELFYAGLDLPALREAVDPRNAHRPVLLVGEPGTGRGILSHYIHQLAEPAREELIIVPAASLAADGERDLLARCAGRRVTIYLDGIDRVERGVQERLLQLLGSSGALEIEPVRWIASVSRARALIAPLRQLPWIRVDLPPLRARDDLETLARGLTRLWAERAGRAAELDESALEALGGYAWPGNLRELEAVVDATLARSAGPLAGAEDVGFGLAPAPTRAVEGPEAAAAAAAAPEGAEQPATPATARAPEAEPAPAEARPDSAPAGDLSPGAPAPADVLPRLADVVPALAQEIREPMLALRTYANLLEQRPDDVAVRREFSKLVERDLGQLEDTVNRLERFVGLKEQSTRPFDLASAIESELERRAEETRACAAVLLRELEHAAPPVQAEEERVRFSIGMLLDRALRMLPSGGELYVGSLYHPAGGADRPAHHRVLIRFHSPEEVLIGPEDGPGPTQPLEVVLARTLIEGMGGRFAVDVSGVQDNVILIELPA
ncbi:MAG: hypothetical protein V3V67_07715 [Myxococcota bacterium]